MSLFNTLIGAAAGMSDNKLYVEDVFSTYLYTGNGSTQTITNGIDLAGEGGLVWCKARSAANGNRLFDTARGANKRLVTDSISAEGTSTDMLMSFNSNGFTLGADTTIGGVNFSGQTMASWTFRKAPKFFDVVTFTATGSDQTIAHGLGVEPGMIVLKGINNTSNWFVYHRSTGRSTLGFLNLTNAFDTGLENYWGTSSPTATSFSIKGNSMFSTGQTVVAYLFAHDPTTDGIIQCGSYTGTGAAGNTVTLGWEPQFIIMKPSTLADNWIMADTMRGWTASGSVDVWLNSQSSSGESVSGSDYWEPTATGFKINSTSSNFNSNGQTYIYLAIRRPMKVPTSGTEVYKAITRTGTGVAVTVAGIGFAPDLVIPSDRVYITHQTPFYDRKRGANLRLESQSYYSESIGTQELIGFDVSDGFKLGTAGYVNALYNTENDHGLYIYWNFRRARGFFDVVCYTGTGVFDLTSHSLGVPPELVIYKRRDASDTNSWYVICTALGLSNNAGGKLYRTDSFGSTLIDVSTRLTSTHFIKVLDTSGATYVAYLFASLAGISKVGSYTGNGTSQTINCGFTTGARFILIKRTDAEGDWYVWDTARGIVSANDPHLSLNTTKAEVAEDDSVDPDTSGFVVNQNTTTDINASGGRYIFLAIA